MMDGGTTAFHVALYWGVLGSAEAQLVVIGRSGAGYTSGTTGGLNAALPGRFYGGNFVTGTATDPSGSATFEVRGWTGNYASYEAAFAAAQTDRSIFVGVSGPFTSPTGGYAGTVSKPLPPEPPPSNLV
ncbi:MAG: hypothetical protein JWQ71_3612 [Pedosphaera sp.]|nr:hypothetical protein [Pedosphaera sp.]